jgi:hypothetical protein
MPSPPMPSDPPEHVAALEAIRIAHLNGVKLSDEEERSFLIRRMSYRITRSKTLRFKTPRGRIFYKIAGNDEDEFKEHPIAHANREQLRKFQMQLRKVFGPPQTFRKANLARQSRAKSGIDQVYLLLDKYATRGRYAAGIVARKTGFSKKYVRELKRKRTSP